MQSPQLIRYSYLYKKNPFSRIFAPLAETYRKLGMYDEAFEVLRKGIQVHPEYVHAYIVLARCHRDLGEFSRAYDVLEQVKSYETDNFAYLTLKAQLSYKLAYYEESLKMYRLLCEIDKPQKYQVRIQELEAICEDQDLDLIQTPVRYGNSLSETDEWVQMNFSETQTQKIVQTASDKQKEELASYTLMKLYQEQGHYSKALRVANTLLASDPLNSEVEVIRDEIIQKRLFEKDIKQFEEDDELSEDHVEENGRYAASTSESDNEDVNELEMKLKELQEKLNFKSAQVQLKEI